MRGGIYQMPYPHPGIWSTNNKTCGQSQKDTPPFGWRIFLPVGMRNDTQFCVSEASRQNRGKTVRWTVLRWRGESPTGRYRWHVASARVESPWLCRLDGGRVNFFCPHRVSQCPHPLGFGHWDTSLKAAFCIRRRRCFPA